MTAADTENLWSNSISERLCAARALSESELAKARARLRADRPCPSWPYGYATSINPLLMTLGVSPGSARSWAGRDPAKQPFDAPTAGKQHSHIARLERETEFGKRVCHLAGEILQIGEIPEEDAYAVFGNVVLDPNRSGRASNVTIKREFAWWILRTIRDHLRPRYLICLGMKGNRSTARFLEQSFDGFMRKEPHREYRFRSYKRSELTFEEWDVEGSHGNQIKIVYWPQHPRRAPFSSFEIWRAACREFAERHGDLIRP